MDPLAVLDVRGALTTLTFLGDPDAPKPQVSAVYSPIEIDFRLSGDLSRDALFALVRLALSGGATVVDGMLWPDDGGLGGPGSDMAIELADVYLREFRFPALDAGSNAAGVLTAVLVPTTLRRVPSSAPTVRPSAPWLVRNFRVVIDNVDTRAVTALDAFTVQFPPPPGMVPPPVDWISPLLFTDAGGNDRDWFEWVDDTLIGRDPRRNVEVRLLAANGASNIATLRFGGVRPRTVYKGSATGGPRGGTPTTISELTPRTLELQAQ
jgi:hypothetical protein